MEALQAQIESQGAKIRTMKEAIKADATSHSKDDLDKEIKELTALKVRNNILKAFSVMFL